MHHFLFSSRVASNCNIPRLTFCVKVLYTWVSIFFEKIITCLEAPWQYDARRRRQHPILSEICTAHIWSKDEHSGNKFRFAENRCICFSNPIIFLECVARWKSDRQTVLEVGKSFFSKWPITFYVFNTSEVETERNLTRVYLWLLRYLLKYSEILSSTKGFEWATVTNCIVGDVMSVYT